MIIFIIITGLVLAFVIVTIVLICVWQHYKIKISKQKRESNHFDQIVFQNSPELVIHTIEVNNRTQNQTNINDINLIVPDYRSSTPRNRNIHPTLGIPESNTSTGRIIIGTRVNIADNGRDSTVPINQLNKQFAIEGINPELPVIQ
mmetsp:Transcript_25366/g.22493  ORF Transcript_25366/g.22493 Transcript_25366/m.22493 type:complete len:146 (-) Transcript_25366:53-490(-)